MITKVNDSWFISESIDDDFPKIETEDEGCVYVIDCIDRIKIGATNNLSTRLKTLNRSLCDYGNLTINKIIFTISHHNYYKNESILHKAFKDFQIKNTEMFNTTIDYFLDNMPELEFKHLSQEETEEKKIKFEQFKNQMSELLFPHLTDQKVWVDINTYRKMLDYIDQSLNLCQEYSNEYKELSDLYQKLSNSYKELVSKHLELRNMYENLKEITLPLIEQ